MRHATWALAAALLGGAGSARAEIICDNLRSDTYVPTSGATVSGSGWAAGAFSDTEAFVAGATTGLGDVKIALWNAQGPAAFTLRLADAADNTLETWSAGAGHTSRGTATSVVQLDSVSHTALHQGETYYLTVSAAGTTWNVWDDADALDRHRAAFRVDGAASAVPEPGSMALLAAGAVGLAGYVRGRRKHRVGS